MPDWGIFSDSRVKSNPKSKLIGPRLRSRGQKRIWMSSSREKLQNGSFRFENGGLSNVIFGFKIRDFSAPHPFIFTHFADLTMTKHYMFNGACRFENEIMYWKIKSFSLRQDTQNGLHFLFYISNLKWKETIERLSLFHQASKFLLWCGCDLFFIFGVQLSRATKRFRVYLLDLARSSKVRIQSCTLIVTRLPYKFRVSYL